MSAKLLVDERRAVAAVEVGARELGGSLDGSNDSTARAGHAVRERLSDSASAVAKTKHVGSDAYNSSIVVTGGAVTAAGGCAGSAVVGHLRSRAVGRLLGSAARLLSNISRGGRSDRSSGLSRSGLSSGSGRSARSEDSATVGWKCGVTRGSSRGLARCWLRSLRLRRSSHLSVASAHFGHLITSGASKSISKRGAVALNDVLTRVGVVEVLALTGAARGIGQVSNEHVRKGGERRRVTLR